MGQAQYHVGDEAMSHAVLDELGRRGLDDVVVLSHDPSQTERLFGAPAALRPAVPWNAFDRHHALQHIKDLAAGRAVHHQHRTRMVFDALTHALEGCDALVVAGGGNMTSQYGGLLFERLAAIHIAKARGLKVVVLGQTFGPVLTDTDAVDLREALALCDLVAVRERSSRELLTDLGLHPAAVLDDATFFGPGPADGDRASQPEEAPFVAASFAPWGGAMPAEEYYRLMGGMLATVAARTGLPIRLLPHVSTPGQRDGDILAHERIAEHAPGASVEVLEQQSAAETARITARAQLVVTTRYHPVVFAIAAGVPVLPIAVDHYGEVRLGGALENWGLASALRSVRHLADDGGASWIDEVLGSAGAIGGHLSRTEPLLRSFQREWWDAVVRTLRGEDPSVPELPVVGAPADVQLTPGEGFEASRLNANNERAIGLLAQRVDFLEGHVKDLEALLATATAAQEGREQERQAMTSRRRLHGLARGAAARLRRRRS